MKRNVAYDSQDTQPILKWGGLHAAETRRYFSLVSTTRLQMQIASLHNSFYSSEEECFRSSESIGTELLPVEEYRDCMFHRAGDLQPQLRRSARLSTSAAPRVSRLKF